MAYFNGSFEAEIELNDKIDSKIFYSTMIDLGFTYYSNDEGTKAVFSDYELAKGIMNDKYINKSRGTYLSSIWTNNYNRYNTLSISLSDNNNSILIKSNMYDEKYFFNILVENSILPYESLFTKDGYCRVNPKVDDIVLLDGLIGYIKTEVDSTFIKYYVNFIITKYKENLNKDSYSNNLESHKIEGFEYYLNLNNYGRSKTSSYFLSNDTELDRSCDIMKIYLDEKIDENIFYDILMKFNISSTDIINKDRHLKLFKFYDYPIYIDNEAKCINVISNDFIFPKYKVNCLGIMIDFLLKENVFKYDDIYTKKGELRGRILLEEATLKNAKSINFDFFSGREEHFGYMRYGYRRYTRLILPYFFDYILGIYKDRVSKDTEAKKDAETKEEIKTEKSRNIVKEIIMNYIPECRDKLKEIKELSQEFEYAIKSDYHKNCDDIESRLENIENRKEFNSIIDEINNLYRNAYNRKHNKSSLSYVMDVEEDDIDLLEHI